MSTTTQNDYKTRYDFITPAELDSGTVKPVIRYTKQELDRAVADARKEECRQRLFTIDGLKKTCGICGVIKETAFHKDASQSHDGCENNYNKAIDDVLATLRKEQV